MSHRKIVIGSRESRLAVVQSETVLNYINENSEGIEASILTLKTTGDKILDRTLMEIGGKGLFVKELDLALREKRTDLSVHSLKDVPMEVSEDIPLIGFSKRADPRDVLVLPEGLKELPEDLPIGSASLRRGLQLKKLFPGHEIKPVRGNLQTRLRKLDEGQFGALVLAAAGLIRLGLQYRINRYFSVDEIIPAAGQGILAIQGRKGEDYSFLDNYLDIAAKYAAVSERAFVTELNGGCTSPVSAHAEINGESLLLRGLYYDEEKKTYRTGTMEGSVDEAETIGISLARELRDREN